MNVSRFLWLPIISVLLILLAGMMSAQVESSSLTGTVTDQEGKRVPHATVRVTETGTGLQRQTETSSQGDYRLLDLPAGNVLGSDLEGRVFHVS